MNDFDVWNQVKQKVHNSQTRVLFKERDILFINMGRNIGFEQDGKGKEFARPVVVFKKFNNDLFWGIPLTKQEKIGKYYFTFQLEDKGSRVAILSQLRLYSAKRVLSKIGMIAELDFEILRQKIKDLC